MKLDNEFYRLPLKFDVDKLIEEVSKFSDDDWVEHPQSYNGNTALLLVTANGGQNDDYVGHMKPTKLLDKSHYLNQVMDSFGTVIGRSRLMKLEPSCEVPAHYDLHYSWQKRTRIHIPIITDPSVIFTCNNKSVHMRPGEAWIFDNWQEHNVSNGSKISRIHLVIDTTGTSHFWDLVRRSWVPGALLDDWESNIKYIPYKPDYTPDVKCEKYNTTTVMPPGEVKYMINTLKDDLPAHPVEINSEININLELDKFSQDWQSTWSLYGDTRKGFSHYQLLVRNLDAVVGNLLNGVKLLSNNASAALTLTKWLKSTLNLNLVNNKDINEQVESKNEYSTYQFDCPVFIVSAPRSGSTMLFELLKNNISLWTVGDETHAEFESIRSLNPAFKNYDSNRLSANDASDSVSSILVNSFMKKMKNSNNIFLSEMSESEKPASFRFLEKTPKNSLRIPFLREIFPNALFIFLYRDPEPNISSIIDAWKSGLFITYPNLPGWSGLPWSLLLPENWRQFSGSPLEEVAAYQWKYTNETIMHDLEELPANQWCTVKYENLISNKADEIKRLCDFAGIPFGPRMQRLSLDPLPLSKYTLSKPHKDKWMKNKDEVERVIDTIRDTENRLKKLG